MSTVTVTRFRWDEAHMHVYDIDYRNSRGEDCWATMSAPSYRLMVKKIHKFVEAGILDLDLNDYRIHCRK